jgi:hypothetical protein
MAGHVPTFTQHTQLFHRRQKLALRTPGFSQLPAFAEEKSIALSSRRQVPAKIFKKLGARAVEKWPTAKIYFRGRLFLLLTYNIWCVESSPR